MRGSVSSPPMNIKVATLLGQTKGNKMNIETPNIVVGLVLFALAAFVAYGRWVIAPF